MGDAWGYCSLGQEFLQTVETEDSRRSRESPRRETERDKAVNNQVLAVWSTPSSQTCNSNGQSHQTSIVPCSSMQRSSIDLNSLCQHITGTHHNSSGKNMQLPLPVRRKCCCGTHPSTQQLNSSSRGPKHCLAAPTPSNNHTNAHHQQAASSTSGDVVAETSGPAVAVVSIAAALSTVMVPKAAAELYNALVRWEQEQQPAFLPSSPQKAAATHINCLTPEPPPSLGVVLQQPKRCDCCLGTGFVLCSSCQGRGKTVSPPCKACKPPAQQPTSLFA